jgi:flagellar hook assembly protein FlgD
MNSSDFVAELAQFSSLEQLIAIRKAVETPVGEEPGESTIEGA